MAQPVRYYTDEHVAKAVVRALRARGVDVVKSVDVGLLGATDQEHFQFACSANRVLFTQDSDFIGLHAAGVPHAGIAYTPQGTPIGEIVRGLMLIFDVLDAGDMTGHLEYV